MNKALEEQIVTAEVNPLQVCILMDVLNDYLPEIKSIFGSETPDIFKPLFKDIDKTVIEIYSGCYSETELFDDAKCVFKKTGSFPDFQTSLKKHVETYGHKPGPGDVKTIEFMMAPASAMFVIFLLRGYFYQFEKIFLDRFSELMVVDIVAMQNSGDAIYEASISKTGAREMAAPLLEIIELTGQFPDELNN